jgi:hypothetical protein
MAGVSSRALRRWRNRHGFCAALHEARALAFDEAPGLPRASALDGVCTLREVATDPDAPPAARVAAEN